MLTRILTFLIAFSGSLLYGQTLVLQPGPTDGYDTFVIDRPDLFPGSRETDPRLIARAWTHSGQDATCRLYIDFTGLSQIPAGATINTAVLTLQGDDNWPSDPFGHSGANSATLQSVVTPWDQTIVWADQPSVSSLGTIALAQSTSENQTYTIDVTQMVQNEVNNPSSYHGFSIKINNETPLRALLFHSSNATTASLRPMLEVQYTAVSGGQDAVLGSESAFQIFPNPSSGANISLAVTTNGVVGQGEVVVTDLRGAVVHRASIGSVLPGTQTYTCSVGGLTNGVYLTTVYVNGVSLGQKKLVITN